MNIIEEFATACAEYLAKYDGADYNDTKQNAMDNTEDLWNYLWWLKTDESRGICIKYQYVI